MRVRIGSLGLLLALSASPGCGCGDDDDVDSGIDGGAHDAGMDAAADVEAGIDASAEDGGVADACPPPDETRTAFPDADWEPLCGLPAHCLIERASRPEAVFLPEWQPCPPEFGGLAGCMTARLDSSEASVGVIHEVGEFDGTQAHFVFGFDAPDDPDVAILVFASSDGPPIAALRYPEPGSVDDGCVVVPRTVGTTHAVFGATLYRPRFTAIYHAPLGDLGDQRVPSVVLTATELGPGSGSAAFTSTSGSTIALEIQPEAFVAIVDGPAVRRVEPTADIFGVPQHVHVAGSDVFWEDWPDLTGVRLVRASIDNGPTVFRGGPGVDVKGFDSDGTVLAWFQGYDRMPSRSLYGRVELWTANRVAGEWVPRKVRDFPPGEIPFGQVSGGYYAFTNGAALTPRVITLTLLETGAQRTYTMPDRWSQTVGFGGAIVGISTTEIFIPAIHAIVGGAEHFLLRIPLSAFTDTGG